MKNNRRKKVPDSVRREFAYLAADRRKRCPICWNYLFGRYEVGHVTPVVKCGDLEKIRKFVGICRYCNNTTGSHCIDLSLVDKTQIIYMEYGNP